MELISVEPTDPAFLFTWQITEYCNYQCMYCDSHTNTATQKTLSKLQDIWLQVYNKSKHLNLPYKVCFTGGEVITNKSFLPLAEWLKSNYDIFMVLTTNGSGSLEYYSELLKIIPNTAFSFHSEYANEKEFFNKIKALKELGFEPFVVLMEETWNLDRFDIYTQFLESNQILYSINKINYDRKIRDTEVVLKNNERL